MNIAYRIVWNAVTGNWVVASELATGRKKGGSKRALAAAVLLTSVLGGMSGAANAAVAVNGNPQEGVVSCKVASDDASDTWTLSTGANCAVPALTGTASAQGNPGANAMFYSSALTNGTEDSLNLGGFLDVWNTATFHGGIAMSGQKITGLADGTAATDAVNVQQLNAALAPVNTALNGAGIKFLHINSALADSNAVRRDSVAIGGGAVAGDASQPATQMIAIGMNASATGQGSVVLGSGAQAVDPNFSSSGSLVAIGPNAMASYGHSIAIGGNANVTPATNGSQGVGNAVGVGDSVNVTSVGGAAFGAMASVTASVGTALGYGTSVSANSGVAVGYGASASTANSVALGANSIADRTNTISVGKAGAERQIVNVAAGTQSTDAVNFGQFTNGTRYFKSTGLNDGTDDAVSQSGVAIGSGASTGAGSSQYNPTAFQSNVAVGKNASAAAAGAIAIGDTAKAANTNIAIGAGADASGSPRQAMALGLSSSVTASSSVALGFQSVADRANTVSVGSSTAQRQIVNMAAGTAPTDAVNVSQLTPAVKALGGGASLNSTTGAVTGPIYTLGNANIIGGGGGTGTGAATNVGDGFTKVDAALGVINTTANKGFNISADAGTTSQNIAPGGTVNYAAGSNATVSRSGSTITFGVAANPTFAGTVTANGGLTVGAGQSVNMGGNKVTNVAAGVATTDAVNMGQLNATNAAVTQNTTDIAGNTTSINNINTQINNGTIGLVQQASAGANLTVGKDTDGAAVDFAGTAGARKLVNVADGAVADDSKEAVNGGQLHGVSQSVANAIGGGSTVNTDGSISAPSYTLTNVDGSTTTVNNVGDAITNLDGRTYSNTTAISNLSQTVNNITNNGAGIKYFHSNSTQTDSVASGVNAVAVGGNAQASASNAVAVGSGAQATQVNSVALGSGSTTSAVTATTSGTVAGTTYAYAGGTPTGTVSVGSAGNERTVTNVAAGQVSATSTDAINGSQLNATNQAVNQLDGRMGNVENNLNNVTNTVNNITNNVTNGQSGMFQVSADSKGTQPVASGSRSTAGGNGAVASGASSTALGNGAQATGSNSVAIGTDSVADRDNAVSVGSAGKERQITNVAAGKADTDAVNVSQLKSAGVINGDGSTNKTVTYDNNTDGTSSTTLNAGGDPTIIHNVAAGQVSSDAATVGQVNDAMQQAANWAKNYTDRQVANVSRQARAGTASAIAVASLPQAYQPGQNSVGVAVGTYQGQSAVSVGMSAISESGRYIFKLSATGAQHTGAGAGIGVGMVW